MMTSIKNSKLSFYLLGIFSIFLVWVIASSLINNELVLPSLPETFKALGTLLSTKNTYVIIFNTILRLVFALSICFLLAVFFAILAFKSPRFRTFFKPILILFKTTPLVILIILFLIMLKRELAMYVILGLTIFPILFEAILNGMLNIDNDLFNEIKLQTNFNFYVIFKVVLPLAIPYVMVGLFQSLGLGLKVLIMAEYVAEVKGSIGYELIYYKNLALDMASVFAWALILIIFIVIFEFLLNLLKKKVISKIYQ